MPEPKTFLEAVNQKLDSAFAPPPFAPTLAHRENQPGEVMRRMRLGIKP